MHFKLQRFLCSGPQINIHIFKKKTNKQERPLLPRQDKQRMKSLKPSQAKLSGYCSATKTGLLFVTSSKGHPFGIFQRTVFPLYFQESDRFMSNCFFIVSSWKNIDSVFLESNSRPNLVMRLLHIRQKYALRRAHFLCCLFCYVTSFGGCFDL